MTDDQFAEQKKPGIAFFDAAAGFADLQLKDYPAAIEAFKGATANNPKDAISYYRLGLSYLGADAAAIRGWLLGPRAFDQPGCSGRRQNQGLSAQSNPGVRAAGCDNLADQQVTELLTLAGTSGDRPATYNIPSAADLQKVAGASTILTVFSDLEAGGDKAKLTWLAICGAQFPSVAGKIIEVKPGNGFVNFEVFAGASDDEIQKPLPRIWTSRCGPLLHLPQPLGHTPAAAQPDVVRLAKDDGILFSGTIASYDPSPFLLHWDQVKVDPSVIPEKAEAGKHHKAPAKQ